MTERTGRCLCGQVQYRITAEPLISRLCWCRDCQHLAGNGTANAIFPTEAIQVSGLTATFTSAGTSPPTPAMQDISARLSRSRRTARWLANWAALEQPEQA